jgi:hypothetical protein
MAFNGAQPGMLIDPPALNSVVILLVYLERKYISLFSSTLFGEGKGLGTLEFF